MFCKYCGKQIDDNSVFCSFCGKNLSSSVQGASDVGSVDDIIKNATWEGIDSNLIDYHPLIGGIPESSPKNKEIKTITINGVSFDMVYIEGGTFIMGDTWGDGHSDEHPSHTVTLTGYYIGKYVVTHKLWKTVMGKGKGKGLWQTLKGNNPVYSPEKDDYPVDSISWEYCQEFIVKLNALTGMTFRLPTEAEWEYAAREGKYNQNAKYSGCYNIDRVAYYNRKYPAPVGLKEANALGLYDMSGNVWEYCADWYGNYDASAQINPQGPSFGSYRVMRGGSFISVADDCRVFRRGRTNMSTGSCNVSFRLVLIP